MNPPTVHTVQATLVRAHRGNHAAGTVKVHYSFLALHLQECTLLTQCGLPKARVCKQPPEALFQLI